MDENIFKDLQEITGSIARKIQAVM